VRRLALLSAFALTAACGGGAPEITRTPPDAPTRAEYTRALIEFGLTRSAVGKDWIAAGDRALVSPVPTAPPFREAGYLAPDVPAAVAYRFDVRRGRKVVIDVTFESITPSRVFVDLFQLAPAGSSDPPVLVAEADPGAMRLEYEARRDAPHVIRLQPEALRGGRYTIVYKTEASLAFPVPGMSLAAIHSTFGAPRDAGRRNHHGVDIFAAHGTPVVAAVDGVVSTRTSNLGGQVIWLRDRRGGRNVYYAHLSRWAVADGTEVRSGDVIGFVGNTGNARSTPPHLHFGVYERGPADPYPFLQPPDGPAPAVTASADLIERWGRTRRPGTALRDRASRGAVVVRTLDAGVALRVMGASGPYYRVSLPDGSGGYVAHADVAATAAAASRVRVGADVALFAAPAADAPVVRTTDRARDVDVLGMFGGYRLVRLDDTLAWLAAAADAGADAR
jgi:hypothetical protein